MPLTPEHLIRDDILRLAAYHVPDSAGYVKLDAMENPYRLAGSAAGEHSARSRRKRP